LLAVPPSAQETSVNPDGHELPVSSRIWPLFVLTQTFIAGAWAFAACAPRRTPATAAPKLKIRMGPPMGSLMPAPQPYSLPVREGKAFQRLSLEKLEL
jgi:hypothetical protein